MWNSFNIILVCIFIYLGIFCLKIFGYYDFTGKYDIQSLDTVKQSSELYFILDNDIKTCWGLDDFEKGDFIIAKFRKIKKIKEIIINNYEYDSEGFYLPKMNIYSSYDSNKWELCNYKLTQNCGRYSLTFDSLCEGKFIKFEYANNDIGHWYISEIEIIE